jgi:DNA-binding NtrC family response regulator
MVDELSPRHGRQVKLIEPGVLELFSRYSWPGNVRELRNVIEHAIVICEGQRIERAHLPPHFEVGSTITPDETISFPVGIALDQAERELILRTLIKTGNNKTRAAEILQISLKTLHNKLKSYREAEEEVQ